METDNYHAGGDGQVDLDEDGLTSDEHSMIEDAKNAANEAKDTVEDAARNAGDAVKDAAEGTGRAVDKAGDTLTGQR